MAKKEAKKKKTKKRASKYEKKLILDATFGQVLALTVLDAQSKEQKNKS